MLQKSITLRGGRYFTEGQFVSSIRQLGLNSISAFDRRFREI
jgi:hypothetical protein